MTVITSGDTTVVEEFYVVREGRGFWKGVEVIDATKIIDCTGDPLAAVRFDTPDAARICIEDHKSLYDGRVDVVKVTLEVKMEEVK